MSKKKIRLTKNEKRFVKMQYGFIAGLWETMVIVIGILVFHVPLLWVLVRTFWKGLRFIADNGFVVEWVTVVFIFAFWARLGDHFLRNWVKG